MDFKTKLAEGARKRGIKRAACSFSVSLVPLPFLRLAAPFPFFLGFDMRSTVPLFRRLAVATYVAVEGLVVDFILLKGRDVVVQLFSLFRITGMVEGVGIRRVGRVESKIGRIVDQELFR